MEGNRCYGTTTVACLIRTGKILVSNSIDLQQKKNKANISPLRTERASSKKVSWLWFYFELTDSIMAHLHQRNARASKTKTLFFFMPVSYSFCQNFFQIRQQEIRLNLMPKSFFLNIFSKTKVDWKSVSERSNLAVCSAKYALLREPIRLLLFTMDQFSHKIIL